MANKKKIFCFKTLVNESTNCQILYTLKKTKEVFPPIKNDFPKKRS